MAITFEQLKKDVLSDIIGVGTIAQIRQRDPKHDISVIFNRLSKGSFFHNHLPVTLMVLDEVLTIDTLWRDEMFQIQAGKTYQNKPSLFGKGSTERNRLSIRKRAAPRVYKVA